MKHLYCLVVSLLLLVSFQSCVEEDGAGVPSPKSLVIESDEYTLDMTDPETPQFVVFRWVNVGNATYTVALSNDENAVIEVLNNEVAVDEKLDVWGMTISKAQLKDYLIKAGFTQAGTYDITISITAIPVDLAIPTALDEEGSVKSAIIHVTRD
jgi:hypothetical protein